VPEYEALLSAALDRTRSFSSLYMSVFSGSLKTSRSSPIPVDTTESCPFWADLLFGLYLLARCSLFTTWV